MLSNEAGQILYEVDLDWAWIDLHMAISTHHREIVCVSLPTSPNWDKGTGRSTVCTTIVAIFHPSPQYYLQPHETSARFPIGTSSEWGFSIVLNSMEFSAGATNVWELAAGI